jgi:hypothetical protein
MKEVSFIPMADCGECLWVTNGKCKHPNPKTTNSGKTCLGFDSKGVIKDLMRPNRNVLGVYKGRRGVWKQKPGLHAVF